MTPAPNAVPDWGNEYAVAAAADIIGSRTRAAQFHRAGQTCLADIELMPARTAVRLLQRLHAAYPAVWDQLMQIDQEQYPVR